MDRSFSFHQKLVRRSDGMERLVALTSAIAASDSKSSMEPSAKAAEAKMVPETVETQRPQKSAAMDAAETTSIPAQTSAPMEEGSNAPAPDALALASILDDELEAAKDHQEVPPKKETTIAEKVKKTMPKKKPAAKVKKSPVPKAKSTPKKATTKAHAKASSKVDKKALKDKQHYKNLLSSGVPLRLLSKRDQGCGKCRHRKWCTHSCWRERGIL